MVAVAFFEFWAGILYFHSSQPLICPGTYYFYFCVVEGERGKDFQNRWCEGRSLVGFPLHEWFAFTLSGFTTFQ